MVEKRLSDVEVWLRRETPRIRKALESASRYFDANDPLTVNTLPVKSISERKKFVLGAFNAGEGRIASAQRLAEKAGKDPQLWSDVAEYLAKETRQYVERVPRYEVEFAQKSPADKNRKEKGARKGKYRCTEGHWRTIDDRPVFICD